MPLRAGSLELLNEKRLFTRDAPDWHLGNVARGRLWAVTLQYHEWLVRLAEAGEIQTVEGFLRDWMERCGADAPGARELAWNAYAVATRVESWIRLAREHGVAAPGMDEALWKQATWLEEHVEWDLRGNHLLRDATGLAWAGRHFEGEDAHRWLEKGTRLALEQASEQVLPDGGHHERSPMYHAIVMEDLASLRKLVEVPAAAAIQATLERMAAWLSVMRHPDGGYPLLNDAAANGAPAPASLLFELGADVSRPTQSKYLPDTGIAAWHTPDWSVFFDVGPIGAEDQPGHAHADTLSIEASFRGVRLFVDPGTHGYDADARRAYDRSTRAHNTVCIDGADSSEVWSIFRVGRRARPAGVECSGSEASAAHDGYDHLPGRPRHSRKVRVNGKLEISDRVTGGRSHSLSGGLLVGPGWKASEARGGWDLAGPSGAVTVRVGGSEGLRLSIQDCAYHPEFGVEVMTKRLCWERQGPLPCEVTLAAEPAR